MLCCKTGEQLSLWVVTVTEGVSVQYLSLTILSVKELSSLSFY